MQDVQGIDAGLIPGVDKSGDAASQRLQEVVSTVLIFVKDQSDAFELFYCLGGTFYKCPDKPGVACFLSALPGIPEEALLTVFIGYKGAESENACGCQTAVRNDQHTAS